MLSDFDEEWLVDVDWDGLEEAALRRRKGAKAQDGLRLPVEPAPSPAQGSQHGSQHSSQPPTPSAMTLVQPALFDSAPFTPDIPNAALHERRQWQENVRPSGGGLQQGSRPAMQSARPVRQGPSVYGEAFDELRQARRLERAHQNTQRYCQPTPIAPTIMRQQSACGSRVRQGAPSSSASWSSGTHRLHDTGGQAPEPPHVPMHVSMHQSWPRTADAVSERQASGASASCSGRGQQQGPYHARQTPSAICAAPGVTITGPDIHWESRPQAWVSLPGGSTAAQAQRLSCEEVSQCQGAVQPMPASFNSQHMAPVQQQLQQQCHSGGVQGVRRDSLGLAAQKDAAAVTVGAQRTALAEAHRRAGEFRALLPRIPPPPSSYEWCPGVFKVAHTAGCGAELRFGVKTLPAAVPGKEDDVVEFWGCTRWPECDFRDVLPKRLCAPQVALEAASAEAFKVLPAVGAEQVIEHCGGLRCVLRAAGIDLSKASSRDDSICEDDGKLAVLFPWDHYQAVVNALRNKRIHGMDLIGRASLIPEITLAAHRGRYEKASDKEVDARFEAMPAALAVALLPFQREGVRYALRRGGRALIADEMGVGKTVQAIALAACYMDEWPLLVVVPASLRLAWAEELARWLPHLRPSAVHVIEGRTDRLDGSTAPPVVVTSYEMLGRQTCEACCAGGPSVNKANKCAGADSCMAARSFKVVIVDESHTLRTTDRWPDSRITEAAVATIRAAARAVLLSGTPSLSRPYDLFRQVDALRPGLLGRDREAFAHRYCNRRLIPVTGRGGAPRMRWCNTGLAHAAELHALLKQEVMLRRLKREVMTQLPPKRRQVVRLPAPAGTRSDTGAEDEEGGSEDGDVDDDDKDEDADEGADVDAPAGQTAAMSVGQRTALAKLPSVLEWLRHALGSGNSRTQAAGTQEAMPKFLVFAHHRSVMAKLAAALEGEGGGDWAGAEYVRIEGATDHRDRRAAAARFRDDPAVRVALLSVTAAGTGLDFSAASAVVFAELPDEVALVRQAEDRAHRHGQRFPVNVYFLLARGTSDERRWKILNRSLEQVTAVHDGGGGAAAAGSAAAAAPGDSAGIALDAVRDVGGGHGWGCTQALPQQDPAASQADAVLPEPPSQALGKRSEASPLVAGRHSQQGESRAKQCQDLAAEEVVVVPDSDDDDSWDTSRKGLSMPMGCQEEHHDTNSTASISDQASVPDQALAPVQASAPDPALAPDQPAEPCRSAGIQSEAALDFGGGLTDDPPNAHGPAADDRPEVWFEVSRHTNRVHFHDAADGSALLGLSLPMDLLTVPDDQGTPQTVVDLLHAVDHREEGKVVVGQAGLLALSSEVGSAELARWLAEARAFAAEWAELRAVQQNQLSGTPLRCPLQDALQALEEKAKTSGAYGISTDRQLDTSRPHLPPPPGAEVATVHVRYVGRVNTVAYKQAFTGTSTRLCIHCMKPVEPCTAPAASLQAVLEGAADLFCSVACEAAYSLRAGGSALRRSLFRLERGRCQACRLHCHALVTRLRVIEKGSRNWKARRQKKLEQLAPSFAARGFKKAAEKLVRECLEGNAWHADHIRPVYKGGGLCQLENLRTLCVPCHQVVTKKQALERAAERTLHKQHTLHAFMAAAPAPSGAAPRDSTGKMEGAVQASGKPARERRQLKRIYVDLCADNDFQTPPPAKSNRK